MTLGEINTKITFYAGVDTTNFPESTRIIDINNAIDDVFTSILSSQDEWDFDDKNNTDFPFLTTDLVASQADYSMPVDATGVTDDITQIKRVDITYDGVTWYRAMPIDVNEIQGSTEEQSTKDQFVEQSPRYDMTSGSMIMYPIPKQNVTAGLKIQIHRSMANFSESDLSTGTKTPGFDKQFHKIIPMKVAYEWLTTKTKEFATADRMMREIEKQEDRLKKYYGDKQVDRDLNFRAANIDYDTDSGSYGSDRKGPC